MKMLYECHARHFYGSFGTCNSMVTFIFGFNPRNGQVQVKLVQTLKLFFLSKYSLSIQFWYRVKNCNSFWRTAIKILKITFQRGDVNNFTWYSGHYTVKNKHNAFKTCMAVAGIWAYNRILCVPRLQKHRFYRHLLKKKRNFGFGLKVKTSEIANKSTCTALNLYSF